MADGITVTFRIPDFKRQLEEVGKRMERQILTAASNAAGRVLKKAIESRAPVLKRASRYRVVGALRRSISVTRVKKKTSRVRLVYSVIPKLKKGVNLGGLGDPFYWRFLEGGWLPRGRKGRIQGGTRTRALRRSRLIAGGARVISFPFILPAFQASREAALKAYVDRVTTGLEKANKEVK